MSISTRLLSLSYKLRLRAKINSIPNQKLRLFGTKMFAPKAAQCFWRKIIFLTSSHFWTISASHPTPSQPALGLFSRLKSLGAQNSQRLSVGFFSMNLLSIQRRRDQLQGVGIRRLSHLWRRQYIWGQNLVKNGLVVFWSTSIFSRIKMLETNLKNTRKLFYIKGFKSSIWQKFLPSGVCSDVILSQGYQKMGHFLRLKPPFLSGRCPGNTT